MSVTMCLRLLNPAKRQLISSSRPDVHCSPLGLITDSVVCVFVYLCVCARSYRICERCVPQKLQHIIGQLPLRGDVTGLLVILHCSQNVQELFLPSMWVTPPTGSTVKHFDALVSMEMRVNWGDAGIISLFAECSVWSGCCCVFRRESRRLF